MNLYTVSLRLTNIPHRETYYISATNPKAAIDAAYKKFNKETSYAESSDTMVVTSLDLVEEGWK